jgi:protein phosphatase
VNVDVKALEYIEGEQLLLCSDGLSNMLTEAQLIDVLNQNISVLEKSNQLIQMALDAGGEDNVSLVLIDRVDETGK